MAPELRRAGLGRELMEEAEQRLLRLGCPKVNLMIRHDNLESIEFYRRLGFGEDAVVSFGRRLVRDDV